MTVYLGTSTPSAYYMGTSAVSALYMGTMQVWTASMPYPVLRAQSSAAVSASNSTTHALTNPTGATTGDLVIHVVGFDFVSGNAVSVSVGTGWTVATTEASASGFAMTIAWKVLNGSGDSLTLATATSEQSSRQSWCFSTYTGSPIISTVNASSSSSTAPDGPSVSFGGTKACTVLTVGVQSQNDTIQSGAPTNYGNFSTVNSATSSSSSVRTFQADRNVTGTSEDPGAWPVAVGFPITVTIAIQG